VDVDRVAAGTGGVAGDLGNIEGDASGNSKGSIMDKHIKLEGPFTVVGRSIMVHADEDDLGTGDHSEPGVSFSTPPPPALPFSSFSPNLPICICHQAVHALRDFSVGL
jgi:hypothetical protein